MANFTALKTAINNAIKTNGNEEITGAILQAILDAMVETLGDSAINDLENAITTEVTNRENAVGGVADDLAAEALARANKDNQLDGRINQEEYNRANADAALSRTVDQGFQTLNSQMTALNAAISALNAAYQNGYLYGGIATPSSSPSNNKCFYIALQGGTYTNFGGVGVVQGINILKNDNGWKVEHIYDQTTLLNEFYLLRQQVIQAITSFAPIVIEGDVTNAPDEEDLTSNAQHLLQFKNNAYSPLEFSGLGRKYLRKNIAPLSESAAFNGFVEGVTAEETLSGTPEYIFWDRMNTRFMGIKDGVYYADWSNSDNYVPASTSLVYMYQGTPYRWDGSDFSVDETEVPNLVNCLTQDMINEANTIYIIRYDYTLKEDITIPAGCILQFDGGSISGEHVLYINFANSSIFNYKQKIDINASLSGENITIDGINVKIINADGLIPTTAENVTIVNNKVESDTTAFRLQSQAQVFKQFNFLFNKIIAHGNYGILLNECKGEDTNIIGNDIVSELGDSIELNFPAHDYGFLNYYKNIKILGNTLKSNADGAAGGIYRGFAIGCAAGKNIIIANNIIKESRQDAIHVEDVNEMFIVVNNLLDNCAEDGIVYYFKENELITSTPIICTGNYVKKLGNSKTNIGINAVYNSDGAKQADILSNNIIEGFNIGVNCVSENDRRACILDGTLIRDCNIGIKVDKAYGNIIFERVGQLIGAGSHIESIVCVTPITADMFFGEWTPTRLTINKLKYDVVCNSDGSSKTRSVPIMPAPTYIEGKINVYVTDDITVHRLLSESISNIKGDNNSVSEETLAWKIFGNREYGSVYTENGYLKASFVDLTLTNTKHIVHIEFDGIVRWGGVSAYNLKKGTTSQRPTGDNYRPVGLPIGYDYYDTTLNKPIWWNGSNWIDATGATV